MTDLFDRLIQRAADPVGVAGPRVTPMDLPPVLAVEAPAVDGLPGEVAGPDLAPVDPPPHHAPPVRSVGDPPSVAEPAAGTDPPQEGGRTTPAGDGEPMTDRRVESMHEPARVVGEVEGLPPHLPEAAPRTRAAATTRAAPLPGADAVAERPSPAPSVPSSAPPGTPVAPRGVAARAPSQRVETGRPTTVMPPRAATPAPPSPAPSPSPQREEALPVPPEAPRGTAVDAATPPSPPVTVPTAQAQPPRPTPAHTASEDRRAVRREPTTMTASERPVTVTVTIGRIELVRSPQPDPGPVHPRYEPPAHLTLSEYAARRSGGGATRASGAATGRVR